MRAAFQYAEEYLPNKLCAIANYDIYFDDTLGELENLECLRDVPRGKPRGFSVH